MVSFILAHLFHQSLVFLQKSVQGEIEIWTRSFILKDKKIRHKKIKIDSKKYMLQTKSILVMAISVLSSNLFFPMSHDDKSLVDEAVYFIHKSRKLN